MQLLNLTQYSMRFKLNRSKTSITSVNRGGIRVIPDAGGVFDTDLYRDNISVDAGSLAQSDGKYITRISDDQVATAKKEVEDLVAYWETTGVAEILDKPKVIVKAPIVEVAPVTPILESPVTETIDETTPKALKAK